METLRASSIPSLNITKSHHKTIFTLPKYKTFSFWSSPPPNPSTFNKNTSRTFKVSISIDQSLETEPKHEKFDWYSHWYPIMPTYDLDKRVPHGSKVLGLDIVVWWDKNENTWKVFDDACPHRLAPLSDGRIDKSGRLQCAYHGWCFNGSGNCKLIPQAPSDGPQVQTHKKACARVYPSVVLYDMVWFWPSTDPKFKDIIAEKQPPYIPEMHHPSFSNSWIVRDMPYGYEVLIENVMDPAHVPYAHYKIMQIDKQPQAKEKVDREGGRPLDFVMEQFNINGFHGKHLWGTANFVAPCTYYNFNDSVAFKPFKGVSVGAAADKMPEQRRMLFCFFCIPVSPGHSRMIWGISKNFRTWIDLIPRWVHHLKQNLIVDSDLHLLHAEEYKLMDNGAANWHKSCFVPTKADAFVIAFRNWLIKFSDGEVNWRGKLGGSLPPTPPREQLMDRYWSHVVKCRSCSSAYKMLNGFEIALPFMSIGSIAIAAIAKQNERFKIMIVLVALISYTASKVLSNFVYSNFHFHDYNHSVQ